MKKWNTIILVALLATVLVSHAYTEIEVSTDNATWIHAATTMNHNITLDNFQGIKPDSDTNYYARLRHQYSTGSSNWTYLNITTQLQGEDLKTSSLPTTIVILLITILLFALPFLRKKPFTNNLFLEVTIRRSTWIIAAWLMTLNSAIMLNIASLGNLGIAKELTTFMLVYGWTGYLLMMFIIIKTIIDIFRLLQAVNKAKRMGAQYE